MRQRAWLLLGALLSALLAAGCGLSGGSIPTGRPRPGRVAGTVIRAVEPRVLVTGALVTVADSAGQVHQAVTDSQGAFAIEGVPPGPTQIGAAWQLPASPAAEGAETARVTARVDEGLTVSVLLAVLPAQVSTSYPVPPAGAYVSAAPMAVSVGESQSLPPAATPTPPELSPSWVVEGGIGFVSPDGVFHAVAPGTGTIRVVFPDSEAAQTVTISP